MRSGRWGHTSPAARRLVPPIVCELTGCRLRPAPGWVPGASFNAGVPLQLTNTYAMAAWYEKAVSGLSSQRQSQVRAYSVRVLPDTDDPVVM